MKQLLRITPLAIIFALAACETAETIDYTNKTKGMAMVDAGESDSAIILLDTYTQQVETDTLAWYYLGMAYHSVDSFEKAHAAYSKSIDLNPNLASVIRNRAIVNMALEQPDKMMEDLEKVAALDSVHPTDYYWKARAYIANDEKDEAYEAIMNGLEMDQAKMYERMFFGFMYDNFSEDFLQQKYYDSREMTVEYTYDADSVRNGAYTSYFKSGEAYQKGFYKEGKRDGTETQFDEKGMKRVEVNYVNGEMNGLRTTWFENGMKSTEVMYKDNGREGWAYSYHENGQPDGAYFFKKNQRDGIGARWSPEGKLLEQVMFVQGTPNGEAIMWNEQTGQYVKVEFAAGQPVSEEPLAELPEDVFTFPKKR